MELSLQIVATAAGYGVRFGASEPAEAPPFDFDPSSKAVSSRLALIEEGTNTRDDLLFVGVQLWGALTPPGIREIVGPMVDEASSEAPLRIRLELPDDPGAERLEALPWEALTDSRSNRFATHPRFALARAVRRAGEIRAFDPVALPLRVLVAMPQRTGLDGRKELTLIERVKDSAPEGAIDLVPLVGQVTPELLREELKKGRYHALHFIGHGRNDQGEGPAIVLNPPGAAGSASVDAFQFASILTGTGVRLAVLNCCLGAAPSSLQALRGLAPEAIRSAGLQAAVAMRYAISDDEAIQFSRAFYRVLLETGRVDTATQAARNEICATQSSGYKGDARAFTTPVLYLAAGGERLCRPASASAASARAAPVRSGRPAPRLPDDLLRRFREGKVIPVVGERRPPAARRGEPPEPATMDGFLRRLLEHPAVSADPAIRREIVALEEAGECFFGSALARVCQYFEWEALFDEVASYFGSAAPTSFVEEIAGWRCPGFLYLPFDGRMERALRTRGARRVLNGLLGDERSQAEAGAAAPPGGEKVVVNVLGTVDAPDTLRLTEEDRDGLLEGIPRLIRRDVIDLVSGVAHRSLLFVGVSPRDPLARGIARLVDRREKRVQGPPFFVAPGVSRADEKYWRPYRVEWIREDPDDVVAALTEASR